MKKSDNKISSITDLQVTLGNILQRLNKLENSNAYTFQKNIQILDGKNIQLGGTKGTQIGTSTSKIGFYGVTPIVQASSINAPNNAGVAYNQTDATTWVTAINAIRTALKNAGITQ